MFGLGKKVEQLQKDFARHQSVDGRRNSDLRNRIAKLEQESVAQLDEIQELDISNQSLSAKLREQQGWIDSIKNVVEATIEVVSKQGHAIQVINESSKTLLANELINVQAIRELLEYTGAGHIEVSSDAVPYLQKVGVGVEDGDSLRKYFHVQEPPTEFGVSESDRILQREREVEEDELRRMEDDGPLAAFMTAIARKNGFPDSIWPETNPNLTNQQPDFCR